ncbi:CBS domain-containing protein [Persephonella sp.]|uniref:CBS domain-containing protein n=1 Tax=Persephonella sp. TaxID=2060922 RepID=UPI0025E65636|nr:CBS domain-containing protein [Persephonella sp.]
MQVIFISEGADLDALSTAFGITLIDPKAKILLPGAVSSSFRLAMKRFESKLKGKLIKINELKKINVLYLADTNNYKNASKKLSDFIDENTKIIIYDHHPIRSKLPKKVEKHIKKTGSASTIVVYQLKKNKIHISPEDATILILGIYEDTGSFTYNTTTEKDLRAAAYLLSKGADLETVKNIIEERIDQQQITIIHQLVENLQYFFLKDKKIIFSFAYSDRYIPDISGFLHMIKPLQEADAYFIMINEKGKTSIIARSKKKDIDVGKIMSYLGGGGHFAAASATVKGLTVQEIKNYIESVLLSEAYKKRVISEFMSRDIITVVKDTQIQEIKEELDKAPVIFVVDKKGKFLGIALSRVLKESLRHGIKDVKIENFIIDSIITFEPSTKLSEAEKTITASSQEYFPVLENGKPVGVINRTYIIKILHGQVFDSEKDIFISRERIKPKFLNFEKNLRKYLPDHIITHLEEIGKLSKKLGYNTYLVGGIVRDIVMSKKSLDIDLIVEGDAVKLSKEYAKLKNIPVHTFEEFMTAQLTLETGEKIDLATARKETYTHPGAYPKVEKATIKEDLYRRDFTINTLAIEITEGKFGILIDFFNGLKDIKDRMIRILHQLSFIEDPIRILRALRFAGRLGFKLGKPTEKLLKLAVDEDMLNVAPTGRINIELNYSLNEERVIDIIMLMNRYRVLHSLIPDFYMDEKREEILNRLRDTIISFEMFFSIKIDRVSNYLLALMYHLPFDISYKILQKYHFSKTVKFFEEYLEVKDLFHKIPQKDSDLYKKIKFIKKDILVYICASSDIELSERIIRILKKEEEKDLLLSGKDLKEMGIPPSPIYKKILDDVFKKYLDGEIKTKKEAIEYVKKHYL